MKFKFPPNRTTWIFTPRLQCAWNEKGA